MAKQTIRLILTFQFDKSSAKSFATSKAGHLAVATVPYNVFEFQFRISRFDK